MKLLKFIEELRRLSSGIHNVADIDVVMADSIPVVKPLYRGGVVYITDVDSGADQE